MPDIAACLLASGTASADDIVVTGFTDSAPGSVPGSCTAAGCTWNSTYSYWDCASLRRAISCSNANTGTDTITFESSGTNALSLVGEDDDNLWGDLDIKDDVIIEGLGSSGANNPINDPYTTIDAAALQNYSARLTGYSYDRAIQVHSGVSVEISGLDVINGWDVYTEGDTGGGCIRDEGDLDLDDVVLHYCTTSALCPNQGGGCLWVDSSATATVTDSELAYCVANESWGGGVQAPGSLSMTGTTLYENEAQGGAGIAAHDDLYLDEVHFQGNAAEWVGGGLFLLNDGSATVEVEHSSFLVNITTETGWVGGFPSGQPWRGGGGIAAYNDAVGDFENVTIAYNRAYDVAAGGIYTFTWDGGGPPDLQFDNTSVHHNSYDSAAVLSGVLCASGVSGGCNSTNSIVTDRCHSGLTATGANLDGTGYSYCSMFSLTGGAGFGTGRFASNGTFIYDLGSLSPANGAGSSCPGDDQEGDSRPTYCDLGADENEDGYHEDREGCMSRLLALVLPLASCSRPEQETGEEEVDTDWFWLEEDQVTVETADGVRLVADYYPASKPGRPAIMLLPGSYLWPTTFYERLHAHDWTVLATNLRGVDESEGEGEGELGGSAKQIGLLDVELFARFLVHEGFSNYAVVANTGYEQILNGFAYQASTLEEVPVPAALAFIAPDETRASTLVPLDLVPVLPTIYAFGSDQQDTWLDGWLQEQNPGCWIFFYYPKGSGGAMELFWYDPPLTIEEDFERFYADLWPE